MSPEKFRCSRVEYLDHLLECLSPNELLDNVFQSLSIDQCAEIVESICDDWDISYPDEVTENGKFHRSLYV